MDIERLTARNKNGLAYLVNVKPDEQEVDSPYKNTLKCILDCFERLAQYEEEDIARQSTTREEVQRAIEQLKYAREQDREFDDGTFVDSLDLAITALQAYQPWIPVSERLPMEDPDGRHSVSKMVLVYAYNGYSDRFASTDITVDGKWYDYSEPEFEVTHWKPLPEPPKGE